MSETILQPYNPSKSITRDHQIGLFFKTIFLPLVLFSTVILLWAISLPKIDPSKMTDLGLVSVLPVTYYAALGILTFGFAWIAYQKGSREFLLLLYILLLIIMIHATPQIVYGSLRYAWSWKHVGIVDYIQRNGSVKPDITNLNAYHNWPGFFAFMAMFNSVAGLTSSLSYAGLAPTIFNILDLGALFFLFTTLTKDRRLIWLSLWLFYLFSWVGQDYFSPQAFAYFLYLVCIAIFLKWFSRQKEAHPTETGSPSVNYRGLRKLYHNIVNHSIPEGAVETKSNALQRLFLMLILIMIFFVMASSHQLTPIMLISSLALLVIFQVTNQNFTPILMGVITAVWVIYMAFGFLNGNLSWIVKSIGSLLDNVNGNLTNLAVVSAGQQLVAKDDRILSVAVWILGLAGLFRSYRSGKLNLTPLYLAIAPLPLVALNSYGGEMIFRVYMFSLPFVIFMAGSLFYPSQKAGNSVKTPIGTMLLSWIVIPAFLLAYYGKERMDYFSPNEVAAAQYVFATAPQGSLIMDGSFNWPKYYTGYEFLNYVSLINLPKAERARILSNPVEAFSEYMDNAAPGSMYIDHSTGGEIEPKFNSSTTQGLTYDYPAAYLVITNSQIAMTEMTGTLPANWSVIIIKALSASPDFKIVYSNPDAVVIKFMDVSEQK